MTNKGDFWERRAVMAKNMHGHGRLSKSKPRSSLIAV